MEDIKPPFDPRAGRRMKLKDAAHWTRQYREARQQTGDQLTRAHYFGKDFLLRLLNEPGCAGLRIYQAIDYHGIGRVVLVGVDEKGQDLLPRKEENGKMLPEESDSVGETPVKCPDDCDSTSPLMQ